MKGSNPMPTYDKPNAPPNPPMTGSKDELVKLRQACYTRDGLEAMLADHWPDVAKKLADYDQLKLCQVSIMAALIEVRDNVKDDAPGMWGRVENAIALAGQSALRPRAERICDHGDWVTCPSCTAPNHRRSVVSRWTQSEAIELCRAVEAVCPQYGCHVALTGGLLYKDGMRKDCDLLFYRIRQVAEINGEGLFMALAEIGLTKVGGFGWCHKAQWNGKPVDCFFPESADGEYNKEEHAAAKDQVAALCLLTQNLGEQGK